MWIAIKYCAHNLNDGKQNMYSKTSSSLLICTVCQNINFNVNLYSLSDGSYRVTIITGLNDILAAVNSFDVSNVSAEISDALCLSSTARATVTENETKRSSIHICKLK